MPDDDLLRRIADDLDIRRLIARLAHLADTGELDEYITLFTEDAAWGGGAQPIRRGREEILAAAQARKRDGLAGPGAGTRHVVTTSWIEIDGEEATGRSVFHFYVETDSESPRLASLGTYCDRFRRTPEGWLLAERLLEGPVRSLRERDD